MKVYSKDGIEMMSISSVQADKGVLVIKGKMMRTMGATLHLKPEELVEIFSVLDLKTFLLMPVMVVQGLWRKMFGKREEPAPGK